jgi:hypothetical protein
MIGVLDSAPRALQNPANTRGCDLSSLDLPDQIVPFSSSGLNEGSRGCVGRNQCIEIGRPELVAN